MVKWCALQSTNDTKLNNNSVEDLISILLLTKKKARRK